MEIRPIIPEEIESLLPIHKEAFGDYPNVLLGDAYLRRFFAWFLRARDAVASAAWEGEEAVGYVMGAPDGFDRGMRLALLPSALMGLLRRPHILLRRDVRRAIGRRMGFGLARGASVSSPGGGRRQLPGPTIVLAAIGVSATARRRGAGSALMREFEERSRRIGMGSMKLFVYPFHESARRFYERCGWRSSGESPLPGLIEYAREL